MVFKRKTTLVLLGIASQIFIFTQPVFASIRDDGDEPGQALSGAATITLFLGIPLLVLGLVSLAILAPQWTRKARQESGFVSHTETWWLNGPGAEAITKEIESEQKDLGKLNPKVGGASVKW
jgi:hypothetical protein